MLNITKVASWRKGQTIVNFLIWLKHHGYATATTNIMADPFFIEDAELERLYKEFLDTYTKK